MHIYTYIITIVLHLHYIFGVQINVPQKPDLSHLIHFNTMFLKKNTQAGNRGDMN